MKTSNLKTEKNNNMIFNYEKTRKNKLRSSYLGPLDNGGRPWGVVWPHHQLQVVNSGAPLLHTTSSLQCCGSGMLIPDPDFYPSRIRGEKKFFCHTYSCSHVVSQNCKLLNFWNAEEKKLGQFSKNCKTFYPKVVTKLSKIRVWDMGSGKNLFRIPDPGVKKAPDPGSATLLLYFVKKMLDVHFHNAPISWDHTHTDNTRNRIEWTLGEAHIYSWSSHGSYNKKDLQLQGTLSFTTLAVRQVSCIGRKGWGQKSQRSYMYHCKYFYLPVYHP